MNFSGTTPDAASTQKRWTPLFSADGHHPVRMQKRTISSSGVPH